MAPRVPRTRLSLASSNPTGAPPRDAVPGDNSAAKEEAERVQLISFISRLTAADQAIEEARAPFDAAKKNRTQIIGYAKAAGFTAKELAARQAEMNMPSFKMAALEERERKQRRWLGIIEPDQAALMLSDSAPQEAKDEVHWQAEGYKAGLRNMPGKPPAGCDTRFVQPFMEGHGRGQTDFVAGQQRNAPRQTAAAAAAQAAADFKADNPEIDVDAAAKKLKADPAFMDRSAPAEPEDPDASFEATPEELASQTHRPVRDESEVV